MIKKISDKIAPLILIAIFAVAGIFVASSVYKAQAAPQCGNVSGWLWSANIGWISLSCNNEPPDPDIITPPSYGVTQDSSGNWTGYGWSPYVGWIMFNAGCPTGNSADAPCRTKLVGSKLMGWAKFSTPNPENDNGCPGNDPSNEGCWDGWLSMSSENDSIFGDGNSLTHSDVSYNVSKSSNHLSGYAWGSDVVGWVYFKDVTIPEDGVAAIAITAVPPSVTDTNPVTTLQYKITSGSQYFDGSGSCIATNSASDSTWIGTRPNLSQSNPISQLYSNVNVPFNNVIYTITCSVTIPGNLPTTVSASVTVGRVDIPTGDVTLSEGPNRICVQSSQNGTQRTTFNWVNTLSTDTSCTLYRDGSAIITGGLIDSYTDISFPSATPATHTYNVKCLPSGGESLTDTVYVYDTNVTAPIDCSTPSWWITFGGGPSTICPAAGNTASLSWQPQGTVPPGYTKTIVYRSATSDMAQGSIFSTKTGTSGTVSGVNQPGYYWVKYIDINENFSPASGTIQITEDCVHVFNGPSGLSPLCPGGSANQVHSVPKTFGWTSNANQCTANGESTVLGGSGTFTVSSNVATQGYRSVSCHWNDGTDNTYSVGYYGPMLATTTTGICGTATTVKNPRIKEE